MQRSSQEKVSQWNQNRAGSIIMIGLSLIALMIIVKIFIQVGGLYLQQTHLEQLKLELQEEIDNLEERNSYLSDKGYYTIYTKDDYIYSDGNLVIIDKD